jgi:hypothetical protein
MASCLGTDEGRKAARELGIAFLKVVLTCGLTTFLTIHVVLPYAKKSGELEVGDPSPVIYVALALITSPLCWGFYALFQHFLPGRREQLFPILFSAVASSMVTVYLLPGFFLYLIVVILGFWGYLTG